MPTDRYPVVSCTSVIRKSSCPTVLTVTSSGAAGLILSNMMASMPAYADYLEKEILSAMEPAAREEIDRLVQARVEARKARDFAEADRIRDQLASLGIQLEDTPQGTVWKRKLAGS